MTSTPPTFVRCDEEADACNLAAAEADFGLVRPSGDSPECGASITGLYLAARL